MQQASLPQPLEHGTGRRLTDRRQRVADVVVDLLQSEGIDTVFGIPGGTIAPIFDALLDRPQIEMVVTKHEMGAVFAAAAYARTSGKLGIVLVTSGPGILNTLTGVATALLDSAPILVLAGEVSRQSYGRGALQEGSPYSLNVVAVSQPLAKRAFEIHEAQQAPYLLAQAIAIAKSGRPGPVVVTLPMDVSHTVTQVPLTSQEAEVRFHIEPRALDAAAKAMVRSRERAIFVGSGCRAGRGPTLVRQLAERLGCPVMTTPKAKGVFPESHPLSLGVFGMGGHPSATAHLERGIETLLALGSSLSDLSTNGWSKALNPQRSLIHVDVDAARLGRVYPAAISVTSTVEAFLDALHAKLDADPALAAELSAPRPARAYGVGTHADPTLASTRAERIAPQRAVWELQRLMPADTIYAIDSGEHYFFATHYLKIDDPLGFLVMTGLGAMGSSFGGAIGAQRAQPERRVVVICGDGGFAMAGTEVATAAQHGLPIIFAVMNDQRLGMVELGSTALYGRTPPYSTGPIDVAGLGRALGAESHVIDGDGQLERLDLGTRRGPIVLDIRIDEAVKMPKNGRFEALGAQSRGTR